MKKITFTTFAAISSAAFISTSALAVPPTDNTNPWGGVSNDLAQLSQTIGLLPNQLSTNAAGLEAYLGALYTGNADLTLTQNYQAVPGINQIMATNTAQTSLQTPEGVKRTIFSTAAAKEVAKLDTSNNVTNSLRQFVYAMYIKDTHVDSNNPAHASTALRTADGKFFRNYAMNHSLSALTIGPDATASDSLPVLDESSKITRAYNANKQLLDIPAKTNDSFLSFSNLFDTTAYGTNDTANAAKRFILYTADSAKDYAHDTGLENLYQQPGALATIKNLPTYQKYVMMVRSIIALRSVNIDALNQLIAERTPMPGLSQAAGLPVGQLASPLQVEAFQADHRIENPTWYTKVQAASPASVQRETLIVLAEIEHQNYQAHLDRERLLAAVTAMNLQLGMSAGDAMLHIASSNLKKAIDSQTGNAPPASSEGSSSAEIAAKQQNNIGTTNPNTTNTTNPNTTNPSTTNTKK